MVIYIVSELITVDMHKEVIILLEGLICQDHGSDIENYIHIVCIHKKTEIRS